MTRTTGPIGADLWKVVVNEEGQYSVWPLRREVPDGWADEGTSGGRDECLAHIAEVWTDMRPASLRRLMESEGLGGDAVPADRRPQSA